MPNQWSYDDPKWQDKDKLEEAYHSGKTLQEIADEFGCSQPTINVWITKHGIERKQKTGGEWTDREKLIELYWGKRLPQSEIADRLGCQQTTISRWMSKYDIPQRHKESEVGNYFTTTNGTTWFSSKGDKVLVSRLIAVAEYGFDSVCDNHVHHKNRIPWDNRPDNLEVLTPAEHTKRHKEELDKSRWDGKEKIDAEDCQNIRDVWVPNDNSSELAEEYGVSMGSIWIHATGECGH